MRVSSPIGFIARKCIRELGRGDGIDFSRQGLCIDVGAGIAPYRQDIEKFWPVSLYVALDIAASDATSVAGDATRMPFRDNCAQFITSFDVIQHVPDSGVFLAEVARVLAPGGLLMLTFPFNYCECDVQDFRRWTLAGMEQDLKRCGLNVLVMQQRGGRFFAFACALNWIAQHIVPGQRQGWRAKRSATEILRAALLLVLTFPTTVFQWLMLGVDALFPNHGCYMGGIGVAVKASSGHSRPLERG